MEGIGLTVELACIVGILPRERVEPQPIVVELWMELDLRPCGDSGDLSASVDYGAVDEQIRFLAVEGRFRLIESLALAIVRLVTSPGPGRAAVDRATVTIKKPVVLRSAEPRVTVSRGPEVLTGDVLVDVPEVRARWVRGERPAGAALAAGPGVWLSVEPRPGATW